MTNLGLLCDRCETGPPQCSGSPVADKVGTDQSHGACKFLYPCVMLRSVDI